MRNLLFRTIRVHESQLTDVLRNEGTAKAYNTRSLIQLVGTVWIPTRT